MIMKQNVILLALLSFVLVAGACGKTNSRIRVQVKSESEPETKPTAINGASTMSLEFLYFEGCPNSVKMLANARQAITSGKGAQLIETDLTKLKAGDPRLRYGAPTLLVNNVDILGQPPATQAGLSCRIYPSGVPDADQIASLLEQLVQKH
jgi:hypothetical protein